MHGTAGRVLLELRRELVQLGDVILHIFVAILRVPLRGESGIFVSGDFLGGTRDVVADLVAGLLVSSASDRKFESGRAIAR